MTTTQTPRLARNMAACATLTVFAFLSVATSKPKGDAKGDSGSAVTASSAAPKGTLLGTCDGTGTFHKDCSEIYAPSVLAEERKKCKDGGGTFRSGTCPRIGAITQCFQGNEPWLFGHYQYEGEKRPHKASDCARGFRDYTSNPELKASSSPVSCDAIEKGGTCSEYSALTADVERLCLKDGGTIKEPSEPCPRTNGLGVIKMALKDGTQATEYYYTTPYTNASEDGQHTWDKEGLTIICAFAGCKVEPFPAAAASASSALSPAKGAPAPKKPATPAPTPAKPPAKK